MFLGEITLERLANNIVVKKTRAEGGSKLKTLKNAQQRPLTPSNAKSSSPKRNVSNASPANKPFNKSPPILPSGSSSSYRSPIPQNSRESGKDSQFSQPAPFLNSMPIFSNNSFTSTTNGNSSISSVKVPSKPIDDEMIGVLSSSSSSSSSSDDENNDDSSSSSSSSSDEEESSASIPAVANGSTSLSNKLASMPSMKNSNMSSSSSDEMDDSEDEDNNLNSLNNNLMNSLNNGISNVGLSNNAPSAGFSMPKFSQLSKLFNKNFEKKI